HQAADGSWILSRASPSARLADAGPADTYERPHAKRAAPRRNRSPEKGYGKDVTAGCVQRSGTAGEKRTWLVNPRRRAQRRRKRKWCRLVWRTFKRHSTTPPSLLRTWKAMSCAGRAPARLASRVLEKERLSPRSRPLSLPPIARAKPVCGHSRSA